MQLCCPSFWLFASTSYQGESGRSQWANISSLALEYSTQRLRPSRSMSLMVECLEGVVEAVLEPALLLLVADREPVLESMIPSSTSIRSKRALAQEPAVLLVGAKPHHPLDPGPVVPAAVEQDDLAPGGELGHVALEVPLRRLPLGRGRQGHDPGEMRGFRYSVMRLIVPPFPAASRPSNEITRPFPSSRTHSCQLISSAWSRSRAL